MFDNRVWEFLVHWAGSLSLCPCAYLRPQLQILAVHPEAIPVPPRHRARHWALGLWQKANCEGADTAWGEAFLVAVLGFVGNQTSRLMLCLAHHIFQARSFPCLRNTHWEESGRRVGPPAFNGHGAAGTAAKVMPTQCHRQEGGRGKMCRKVVRRLENVSESAGWWTHEGKAAWAVR